MDEKDFSLSTDHLQDVFSTCLDPRHPPIKLFACRGINRCVQNDCCEIALSSFRPRCERPKKFNLHTFLHVMGSLIVNFWLSQRLFFSMRLSCILAPSEVALGLLHTFWCSALVRSESILYHTPWNFRPWIATGMAPQILTVVFVSPLVIRKVICFFNAPQNRRQVLPSAPLNSRHISLKFMT